MGTLNEDLTAIKAVEDKLTVNKVANFAYTNHAYEHPLTEADGVETYDVNNEQNIPVANASIMKVNPTILTKGWRSQASSITRMLMNHFLGRCSYNLNKINDLMSNLLSTIMSHLGTANGLATLDANGYVPTTQLSLSRGDVGLSNVVNTGDSAVPAEDGTDKFTTGGAYNLANSLQNAINGKAPINHASSGTDYGVASETNYGHVRTKGSIEAKNLIISSDYTYNLTKDITFICVGNAFQTTGSLMLNNISGSDCIVVWFEHSLANGGKLNIIGGIANGATQAITIPSGPGSTSFVIIFKNDVNITTIN